MNLRARLSWIAPLVVLNVPAALSWGGVDPSQYAALQWRLLGPHRGGRVTAVAGIPGDERTFYMGLPAGGVFKTMDGGNTWAPIFDATHVASVGALAVAPSDPSRIYVGTGEMCEGNGVWRSDDAGARWRHVGPDELRVVSVIRVDPQNPDALLVGAEGSVVEPSEARGVYRSTDGGATWSRVLYRDASTGVMDLASNPDDSRVVYASLRRLPLGKPLPRDEPDSWLYRSTDSGGTWQEVGSLPAGRKGRIGVAVAPGTGGKRVYAIFHQGVFRSDDGAETFRQATKDTRVVGNEGFSKIFVDPKDENRVWVVQTSLYLSSDGGVTFASVKGAPGGDDYRTLWIDPKEPRRMIVGSDQGVTISVNAGLSWTPWFNQPTGQFYHVSTDNQHPYYAYAQQQDSGTVAVPNRSDYGEITYRDWFSVGGFEYGYIAPDPLHPNVVYATGWYSAVVRFDRVTGQITPAFIPGEKYRTSRAGPLLFSPRDPRLLYLGAQRLLATRDEGATWAELSPDLIAPGTSDLEEDGRTVHHGVSALAPSPERDGLIWVGTSDGLVHHTRDEGRTWLHDTVPAVPPKPAVVMIEASPHDPAKAFAVFRPRGGVFDHAGAPHARPSIFRTTDEGATWREIVRGLPEQDLARALREDPVRKGLLYLATDSGVFVSFDDGDLWQPLQLNLPTTSVRDLTVHGDDLLAATYGRGLWVLDDLVPLREAGVGGSVALLKPPAVIRYHWDNDQETPLPPEVPAAENPPDGAILDYVLGEAPKGEVTLEIRDGAGKAIRRFSSAPGSPDTILPRNVPDYWFGPPSTLSTHPGHNRFVWDLRVKAPAALTYSYLGAPLTYMEYTLVDDAIVGRTPREQPQGPLVAPGHYEAVLTLEGQSFRQGLDVEPDPRVPLTPTELARQVRLSMDVAQWMDVSAAAHVEVLRLRASLDARRVPAGAALRKTLESIDDGGSPSPGFGPINRDLGRLLSMLEEGDGRLNATLEDAALGSCRDLRAALERLQAASRDAHAAKLGQELAAPAACEVR